MDTDVKIEPEIDGVVLLSDQGVFFKDAKVRPDGQKIFHVFEWSGPPIQGSIQESNPGPIQESIQESNPGPIQESIQGPIKEPIQGPIKEPIQGPIKNEMDYPSEAKENYQEEDVLRDRLFMMATESNLEDITQVMKENGIPFDEWCPPIAEIKTESSEEVRFDSTSNILKASDTLLNTAKIELSDEDLKSLSDVPGNDLSDADFTQTKKCKPKYDKDFTCTICNLSSKYKANVRTHIMLKHKEIISNSQEDIGAFVKVTCGVPTNSFRSYSCTLCVFITQIRMLFKDHLKINHKDHVTRALRSFVLLVLHCKFCDFSSENRDKMINHIEGNHGKPCDSSSLSDVLLSSLKCRVCSFPIGTECLVKKHFDIYHAEILAKIQNERRCEGVQDSSGREVGGKTQTGDCFNKENPYVKLHDIGDSTASGKQDSEKSYRNSEPNGNGSVDYRPSKVFSCNYCPYSTRVKRKVLLHVSSKHLKSEEDVMLPPGGVGDLRLKEGTPKGFSVHVGNTKRTSVRYVRKRTPFSRVVEKKKKKVFTCKRCKYSTTRKKALKEHQINVHSHNPHMAKPGEFFKCKDCGLKTRYRYSLERHMFSMHGYNDTHLGKHNCTKCDFVTMDLTKLRRHYTFIHKGETRETSTIRNKPSHSRDESFLCSKCSFRTKSISRLEIHEKTHEEDGVKKELKITVEKLNGVDEMNSQNSGGKILFDDGVETLIEIERSKGTTLRIIPNLTKLLRRQKYITRHSRERRKVSSTPTVFAPIKKAPTQKGFPCSECSYTTEVKMELWEHKVSSHAETNIYKCRLCIFVADSLHKLKVHLRFHNKFLQKKSKHKGRRSQWTTDTKYTCDSCDYVTYSYNLKKQHDLIHMKKKNLLCAHCDYATNFKGNLIKHVLIHE